MITMKARPRFAALAASLAIVLAACGGDDSASSSRSSGASGNGADRAFVAEMVPHHESAIEMAQMAKEKARHAELKTLADDIIKAQQSEITRLKALDAKLEAAGVAKGDLGVDEAHSGMGMDMAELEDASPFDKKFIDMMISHHEGAITMARAELSKGKNGSLRDMAEQIISAQQAEVNQMRDWRKAWYASSMDDSKGMDH